MLIKLDTEDNLKIGLKKAADSILSGGVVAIPTESFYGLGADALNTTALDRIYLLKRRARHLPLLCLIKGFQSLELLVKNVTPWVHQLMEVFWPGPLTLVLPARSGIPAYLLGPTGGVAVRWSPSPVAQELVSRLGTPLVGTSANLSGEPPATRLEQISMPITMGVDGILDGGATAGKVPSTVLDCTLRPPKITREGAISEKELNACLHS